ncbi:hypothetical protein ACP6NA_13905, partial [Corynebacterium striatum]|uniref:hypothetical protein n=1 Tax=Corynebacterium striatum TaxID=43770 RepID=UPI003F7D1CEA
DEAIAAAEHETESYGIERPSSMKDHAEWSAYLQKKIEEDTNETEKDKVEQKDLEASGAKDLPQSYGSFDHKVVARKNDVPEKVRLIHKKMCMMMLQWWMKGLSSEDSAGIVLLNDSIRSFFAEMETKSSAKSRMAELESRKAAALFQI